MPVIRFNATKRLFSSSGKAEGGNSLAVRGVFVMRGHRILICCRRFVVHAYVLYRGRAACYIIRSAIVYRKKARSVFIRGKRKTFAELLCSGIMPHHKAIGNIRSVYVHQSVRAGTPAPHRGNTAAYVIEIHVVQRAEI